jgi:hypothetical protein
MLYTRTSLEIIILLIIGMAERNISAFQEKEKALHGRSFKRFVFCCKMLCIWSFVAAINFRNTEPNAAVVIKPASEMGIPGVTSGP